jgi:hypothetical protein
LLKEWVVKFCMAVAVCRLCERTHLSPDVVPDPVPEKEGGMQFGSSSTSIRLDMALSVCDFILKPEEGLRLQTAMFMLSLVYLEAKCCNTL